MDPRSASCIPTAARFESLYGRDLINEFWEKLTWGFLWWECRFGWHWKEYEIWRCFSTNLNRSLYKIRRKRFRIFVHCSLISTKNYRSSFIFSIRCLKCIVSCRVLGFVRVGPFFGNLISTHISTDTATLLEQRREVLDGTDCSVVQHNGCSSKSVFGNLIVTGWDGIITREKVTCSAQTRWIFNWKIGKTFVEVTTTILHRIKICFRICHFHLLLTLINTRMLYKWWKKWFSKQI